MNNHQDKSRSKDASSKPNASVKPLAGAAPRREGIQRQAEAGPPKQPSPAAVAGKDGHVK